MKKLITLSILFVLTSIVLMSCKSSSVMKRRYNKGYYVHHSAKHSEPKTNKAVKSHESVQSPALAETIIVAPATKETASLPTPNVTAGANTTAKPATAAKSLKNSIAAIPAEYSIAKPFKTLKNIGTKVNSSDAAGEALSLLWILIVVVLILYLLSFLFGGYGLGGFVHLLAVIFLVLLILWLLRII